MAQKKPISPVARAASGAMLVGGIFTAIGGLLMMAVFERGAGLIAEILCISSTLILIGPGVWYFCAGFFLKRGQFWALKITYRIALAQLICVVLAGLGFLIPSRGAVIAPAILAIFFFPALLALMFDLRRAQRELVSGAGHGFAVRVLEIPDAVAATDLRNDRTTDEHR